MKYLIPFGGRNIRYVTEQVELQMNFPFGWNKETEVTIKLETDPNKIISAEDMIKTPIFLLVSPKILVSQPIDVNVIFNIDTVRIHRDIYGNRVFPGYVSEDGVRVYFWGIEDQKEIFNVSRVVDGSIRRFSFKIMRIENIAVFLVRDRYNMITQDLVARMFPWMNWRKDRDSKGQKLFNSLANRLTRLDDDIMTINNNFHLSTAEELAINTIFKIPMPEGYDMTWKVRADKMDLVRILSVEEFLSPRGFMTFVEDYDNKMIITRYRGEYTVTKW